MKPTTIILLAGATLMFGACDRSVPSADRATGSETAASTAAGTGTVTAVDTAAGKITLDHAPIAEAGWPAMTMTFDAKPAVLDNVAVGDKVAFDLTLKGGAGEVTAIRKQ